jgi:hypothetical protein
MIQVIESSMAFSSSIYEKNSLETWHTSVFLHFYTNLIFSIPLPVYKEEGVRDMRQWEEG